ncbi:phosphotransferase enzyme family protein [Xylariaceae sp. FL0016]|nr:phosphotransferase enzyme family protein [Xylariaceae sp. FL0016]
MTPQVKAEEVASIMLSWHGLELVSYREMQSLWAGYGHISEVKARATSDEAAARLHGLYGNGDEEKDTFPLVLKLISPPPTRPGKEDEGHLRKILSYEVEQYFYSAIAPRLDSDVAVARCVASTRDMAGRPGAAALEGLTATLMTDLRPAFPIAGEKRAELDADQVHAALRWLAGFHKSSWKTPSTPRRELLLPPLEEAARRRKGSQDGHTVWLNGGYTYLATRRKEYGGLASDDESEWSAALCEPTATDGSSIAEIVAQVLSPRNREQETLIHGDVKSENLFASRSGHEVAFFDFQYAGLGLGVCDLAKLFTCSVPLNMLLDDQEEVPDELPLGKISGEEKLLRLYHKMLLDGTSKEYEWDLFVQHWEAALVDWLRFQASWGFWGNTEWLEARVRCILKDKDWVDWLHEEHRALRQETNHLPN